MIPAKDKKQIKQVVELAEGFCHLLALKIEEVRSGKSKTLELNMCKALLERKIYETEERDNG
jgi:hypothetical protein